MAAIGAGVDRGRRDARHDVAGALADEAAHVELRDHAFHHGEHRLVQRHVHHLTETAVDLAMAQRHQRADHRPQRGNRVADADAGAHWRTVLEAGDVTQPAHRLADRAEARLILHRPGLAEAGQAHHHQLGIQRMDGIPAEPQLLQHAGAEVFDQDVGLSDQLAQDLLAVRVLEVERQRLLVARLHEPPQ